MTETEFSALVHKVKKGNQQTIDVRKAGAKQGEAVNFYLQSVFKTAREEGSYSLPIGVQSIIILHTKGARFDANTLKWYGRLHSASFPLTFSSTKS